MLKSVSAHEAATKGACDVNGSPSIELNIFFGHDILKEYVNLVSPGWMVMTEDPHIRCDRRHLIRSKLRSALRWHGAAMLLRLRNAFRYRFLDSSKAAIAPEPLLSHQRGTQRSSLTAIAMASNAWRSGYPAVVDEITQCHHLCRSSGRNWEIRGFTGIWMRALWGLCCFFDYVTSGGVGLGHAMTFAAPAPADSGFPGLLAASTLGTPGSRANRTDLQSPFPQGI